jgi:hypothetical protein
MPRPWYREIWPWLLMLPPAASVVGGIAMVYLATHTTSALVVDDYARIEALTSEQFERDRRAGELGLAASLMFADAPGRIELQLGAPAGFAQPPSLLLRLRHVTNPAADVDIELVRAGDSYVAATPGLPGQYHPELMPSDRAWRLSGDLLRARGRFTLSPQTSHARVGSTQAPALAPDTTNGAAMRTGNSGE